MQETSDQIGQPNAQALSTLETLRLGAAQAYYSISRALKFNKVAALLQRAELSTDAPVWLLGRCYDPTASSDELAQRKVLSDLALHFQSSLWMTYRSGFMPLGAGEMQLRSDAGWGCTLRVAQMLLAQALQRRLLGPDWRWMIEESNADTITERKTPPTNVCRLVQLFWDVPVESSPFSLHNICKHGAEAGVFPGRWLGPWTACCALAAAAQHAHPSLGLRVAVLGGGGGGTPELYTESFSSVFKYESEEGNTGEERNLNAMQAPGLLLLVPLVLGLGKFNSLYVPQVHAVLSMPQSVGLIGGSPGSSLYIVGYQQEAALYLDPHEVQPAACSDADCETFRGDALRTLPLLSIDPSVALGFYCGSSQEYEDLCGRLRRLELEHPGAPVVCVREGIDPGPEEYQGGEESWASDVDSSEDGGGGAAAAENTGDGDQEGWGLGGPERRASSSKSAWELI